MANFRAVHAVGYSLIKHLKDAYPSELSVLYPCNFQVIASGELNAKDVDFGTAAITLYLYRVDVNQHLRNSQQVNALQQATTPISLDLSYLLTIWAGNAVVEHTLLGWAVRQLHMHLTLDYSELSQVGGCGWEPGDLIQLVPTEISNEDMMRIWDAVDPGYRLSLSYIARAVRIDAEIQPDALPVVAKSLRFIDNPEER